MVFCQSDRFDPKPACHVFLTDMNMDGFVTIETKEKAKLKKKNRKPFEICLIVGICMLSQVPIKRLI